MPRQRWIVELSQEGLARLRAAGPGLGPLQCSGRSGPVELRVLRVEGLDPTDPTGAGWSPGAAAAELIDFAEDGLPVDDPRMRALAKGSAEWWEEQPAGCAEADRARASLLLAHLEPEEAERALRPWLSRPAPGLLVGARLAALRAECLAVLGLLDAALVEASAALSTLERRPLRCALGEQLRGEMLLLGVQLGLELGEPGTRVGRRLGLLAGPPTGWPGAPLGQGPGSAEAELGLLRAALAAPAEQAELRERWIRVESRWAPRGAEPLGRQVALLRGLLCAEAGMPLEARAWWATAAVAGGGRRARLVALAAQRLREAGGPAGRAEARTLAASSAFAARALDAVERAAALAPGRARFLALPLWLR
jgi:hypothetical protein